MDMPWLFIMLRSSLSLFTRTKWRERTIGCTKTKYEDIFKRIWSFNYQPTLELKEPHSKFLKGFVSLVCHIMLHNISQSGLPWILYGAKPQEKRLPSRILTGNSNHRWCYQKCSKIWHSNNNIGQYSSSKQWLQRRHFTFFTKKRWSPRNNSRGFFRYPWSSSVLASLLYVSLYKSECG